MAIPVLERCFFGVSPRTVTIVLGGLGAFFGSMMFSYAVVSACSSNHTSMELWAYFFQMIYGFVCSISSVVLLVGIFRSRAFFVKQWLVAVVILGVGILVWKTCLLIGSNSSQRFDFIVTIFGIMAGLGVHVYVWLIGYAVYLKVRSEESERAYQEI